MQSKANEGWEGRRRRNLVSKSYENIEKSTSRNVCIKLKLFFKERFPLHFLSSFSHTRQAKKGLQFHGLADLEKTEKSCKFPTSFRKQLSRVIIIAVSPNVNSFIIAITALNEVFCFASLQNVVLKC